MADAQYIEIDRANVARYFYWSQLYFLIPKRGEIWAREAADSLQYFIADDVLHLHEGRLFRTRASLPLDRISHTVLSQGPLERRFGIWKMKIYTVAYVPQVFSELRIVGPVDPDLVRLRLCGPARSQDPA